MRYRAKLARSASPNLFLLPFAGPQALFSSISESQEVLVSKCGFSLTNSSEFLLREEEISRSFQETLSAFVTACVSRLILKFARLVFARNSSLSTHRNMYYIFFIRIYLSLFLSTYIYSFRTLSEKLFFTFTRNILPVRLLKCHDMIL